MLNMKVDDKLWVLLLDLSIRVLAKVYSSTFGTFSEHPDVSFCMCRKRKVRQYFQKQVDQ